MKTSANIKTIAAMLLLFAAPAAAQDVHPSHNENTRGINRCGTEEYLELQKQKDPGLEARMAKTEADMQAWMKDNPPTTNAVIVIPVVFHIVYNTAVQNVADTYIYQQIDVLNQQFSKQNSDWTKTPSVFQPLVANCNIQFCLASKDPSGNPTNGIVRKSTTVPEFGIDDAIKYTSQGGDDIWDRDKYMNIWVCRLAEPYGGYATYPGVSSSAEDGVVIRTTSLPGQTFMGDYDLGKIATHEVGHWLNLKHLWANGYCLDDLVSDTPTQEGDHMPVGLACPTHPYHVNMCGAGTSPDGEMFMNYMDYTYDRCKVMFSNGQKDRMQATLNGTRSKLLSSASTNCEPPANPISVPSAFTPNGDAVNDMLYVLGVPLQEMDFRIYNEWGNEIFRSTDQSVGWDGKYKDKPQPGGRYAYVVKGTLADGAALETKGDITIIR